MGAVINYDYLRGHESLPEDYREMILSRIPASGAKEEFALSKICKYLEKMDSGQDKSLNNRKIVEICRNYLTPATLPDTQRKVATLFNNEHNLDATLKVLDRPLHVHEEVLSACSPFFKGIFSHKMTVSDQVDIQDEILVEIIKYAYTQKIPEGKSLHFYFKLYIKAFEILATHLCAECIPVIKSKLVPEVDYFELYELLPDTSILAKEIHEMIKDHLKDAFNNCSNLQKLTWEDLEDLLKENRRDQLNGLEIFETFNRWMKDKSFKDPIDKDKVLRILGLVFLNEVPDGQQYESMFLPISAFGGHSFLEICLGVYFKPNEIYPILEGKKTRKRVLTKEEILTALESIRNLREAPFLETIMIRLGSYSSP